MISSRRPIGQRAIFFKQPTCSMYLVDLHLIELHGIRWSFFKHECKVSLIEMYDDCTTEVLVCTCQLGGSSKGK